MIYVKDISWEEVFEGWREREANNPAWVRCATELKGWPDWESWRRFSAEQFKAAERTWRLYRFTDPMSEIPSMLMGPYGGWQSRAPHKNQTTFEQLLAIPEQHEELRNHPGVKSILQGMPFATQMIGLIRDDTNQIVCVEGHHRSAAIALARQERLHLDFTNHPITIALAHLGVEETGLLDTILERGTSREPESHSIGS